MGSALSQYPCTSIFDDFIRSSPPEINNASPFLFSVRLLSLEAVFRTAALQVFACYSQLTEVLYRIITVESALLQNLTYSRGSITILERSSREERNVRYGSCRRLPADVCPSSYLLVPGPDKERDLKSVLPFGDDGRGFN